MILGHGKHDKIAGVRWAHLCRLSQKLHVGQLELHVRNSVSYNGFVGARRHQPGFRRVELLLDEQLLLEEDSEAIKLSLNLGSDLRQIY